MIMRIKNKKWLKRLIKFIKSLIRKEIPPPTSQIYILTEDGDELLTENGDNLIV